jgi:succinylarginine dihydrolase
VLTEEECALLPPGVFLDEALYVRLNAWIRKNYRDKVTAADLCDPMLLEESRRALDELTQILGLGSIYPFQKG